jgi:hypothetical protein
MSEITVIIEACEPMELMRHPTGFDVWFRLLPIGSNGWEELEIRGEDEEVWKFIEYHWSADTADAYVYEIGPFSKKEGIALSLDSGSDLREAQERAYERSIKRIK